MPSRRGRCWARWSLIARSASSGLRRSSGPLAALAGYALLSLALFGRGVLRDGGGSVVGSYGSDQATFAWSLAWWPHAIGHGLHPLLTDLVYAPGRLEPGLDELHPGPGAAGLAADGGLRARAGLRRARAGRAGAGGLVHVPPLPRAGDGHAGGAGRRPRLRLRHLRGCRDAQPPQSRARVHAPAGRPRRRPLPARLALGPPLRGALRALRRRRVRDVPGDALLGDAGRGPRARPGHRVRARRASARGSSAASRLRASRMASRSSSQLPISGSRWPIPIRSASAAAASSSTSPICSSRRA